MLKCKFFVGTELAHTNFNGTNTLFVSGFAYTSTLLDLCTKHSVKHVHLGYKGVFQKNKMYNQVINDLFEAGYKVTLEYPAEEYTNMVSIIDSSIWNNRNFVPLMTVNIGNAYSLGQNSSIQFTDDDSANAGFWSSSFSSILDSNNYESAVDVTARVSLITDDEPVTTQTNDEKSNIVTVDVVDQVELLVDATKPARKPRGPNKAKKNDSN